VIYVIHLTVSFLFSLFVSGIGKKDYAPPKCYEKDDPHILATSFPTC